MLLLEITLLFASLNAAHYPSGQVKGVFGIPKSIITVPDHFPTIQQAIVASNDGDTVFVRSGTYHE
jgi:hypothetical protein